MSNWFKKSQQEGRGLSRYSSMVFAEILVPQTDERSEYDAVEKKFAEFAARSEKEGISFTNQSPYRFERHE